MPPRPFNLPASLLDALREEAARRRCTESSIVLEALRDKLQHPIHTLFQVSTSGALVAGVFAREVSVATVLEHGDFGLGTFENLDGEMVVLEGRAFQVLGTGEVREAPLSSGAPFAVVTRFQGSRIATLPAAASIAEVERGCDAFRSSGNIFYAMRLDGRFDEVRTRAVSAVEPGVRLIEAAKDQHEFVFHDLEGTLVGIWSPGFSSAFSVAGYHFHFISNDRRSGGHVLDIVSKNLRLQVDALTEFHLALPETASFLKADLDRSSADELAYAEQAH